MKKNILIIAILFFNFCLAQQNVTTYYFIRHAEKADDSKNPDLSENGLKRAKQWNAIFADVHFDEIYTTDYKRTTLTAAPTATAKNIKTKLYDLKDLNIENFKNETLNKKVLIVGHSNSIPKFVNQVIKNDLFQDIPDNVFGNLYIITITGDAISYHLLKLP
jgi:broad specificity phosphatase PhoE